MHMMRQGFIKWVKAKTEEKKKTKTKLSSDCFWQDPGFTWHKLFHKKASDKRKSRPDEMALAITFGADANVE